MSKKVLVIGTGSIGERHVQNLIALGARVQIFDLQQEQAQRVAQKYNVRSIEELSQEVLAQHEVIIICTPTHTHLSLVERALAAGCHVFVEKPLAEKTSTELHTLVQAARTAKNKTLVGCNLRFHPALQRIKQVLDTQELGKVYSVHAFYGHYLPNWRAVDYRQTYSAKAEEGGGILLEAIHEFDYLSWFFGKVTSVFATIGKVSGLEITGEDIAKVILTFENGVIGELHLDYLQKMKRRGCEIIGSEKTIRWESLGKKPEQVSIRLFGTNEKPVEEENITIDGNEMYLHEMNYFLGILQNEPSMNPLETGMQTLKIIEAAKESARTGKAIFL